MIDIDFINSAYVTLERGLSESRRRKKRLARRSVIKNFIRILFFKRENTFENKFLLYPRPEIEIIFPEVTVLEIDKFPFLKKALFFLQLGYISPSEKFRFWAAKKGYGYLQHYFSAPNITIINCGPSLLSPFLAKLCEDKHDHSKYFIIQHGLYQHHYKPYEFEFSIKACRSVVWSNILAQNYIALGMPPEKIQVLPTHLFSSIKKLNKSKKVLIIGESLNKIFPGIDDVYEEKIIQVVNYLNGNSYYNEIYFKKHPRALSNQKLDEAFIENSVAFLDKINLSDFGLVIGVVSTMMIEALSEGCRVLQLSLKIGNALNIGDYSLFTSVENLDEIEEIEEKIRKLESLETNYIQSNFLRVENNFGDYYKELMSRNSE